MRQSDLSVDKELLQVALLIFSVVSLATLEFMKNAFPSTDALRASRTIVVYMIVIAQVLPALVLLAVDRLIAARDSSGRGLRVFRTVLFVVAFILIARQLQLYWGQAEDFADSVRSAGLALLVLVDLAILVAIIGLAIVLYRGMVMFFYYMSPIAIAMTAIMPFQVPTVDDFPNTFAIPETYAQEVTTATPSESQPAVFVLVFDELGYNVLLEQEGKLDGETFPKDGKLDAESFPNIAALAQDGVWFTDATTNYIWTGFALTWTIINPVKSLSDHFNVRLYSQFIKVEQPYFNDCGKVMTCRGYGYLMQNNELRVAGNLVLRAFYQAIPKPVETAISRPTGWLLDRIGWPYPTVDRPGFHTFTKRQFDVFLNDIERRESRGRIHVLHLLLPHHPFVFDREGDAVSTASPVWEPETYPQRYREQAMYVDRLVGQLIDKLKREGIYDDSVIVLTGDHGPRPFTPSEETPPDAFIPHVPLVIHAPGLDSGVSDVDYQHEDFGPTLTDILGLPPLNDTEGVSAFSKERPQRDKVFRVEQLTFVYSEEDDSWQLSQEQ